MAAPYAVIKTDYLHAKGINKIEAGSLQINYSYLDTYASAILIEAFSLYVRKV